MKFKEVVGVLWGLDKVEFVGGLVDVEKRVDGMGMG